MNQLYNRSSLSEIPLRQCLSDPTPRGQRVGTPYPIPIPQKAAILYPTKIPRLDHRQYSPPDRSHDAYDISNTRPNFSENCQQSNRNSPSHCHNSSQDHGRVRVPTPYVTLTLPKQPEESQLNLSQYCHNRPISPAVVQLYKKNPRNRSHSNFNQNHNQNSYYNYQLNDQPDQTKAIILCQGTHVHKSTQNSCTVSNLNSNCNGAKSNILDSQRFNQEVAVVNQIHRNDYLHSQNKSNLINPPYPIDYDQDRDRDDYLNQNENKNSLPPLPPNANVKSKNSIVNFDSKIRLATATISQGNNVLGCKNRNNINSTIFSPSISTSTTTTDGIGKNLKLRKFNPSSTSTSLLSKVHIVESCTNLQKRFKSQSENFKSSHNCPLCAESKGQCHLHHRTMCSRYMTDLEWRICNAVNVYVYKNGEEGQTPVLIHIPPNKKKNMRCVMSVIQERIYYPIGYAKDLYRMNGKKVTSPCELEMYNNYVVASNYDKTFKCVCYARRKSPLLILAKESKHVRELRLKNYQYELYLAKQIAANDEQSNCVYGGHWDSYEGGDAFNLSMEKTITCQPCPYPNGPAYPTKICPKKQRCVVIPAVEEMNCSNCNYPSFTSINGNRLNQPSNGNLKKIPFGNISNVRSQFPITQKKFSRNKLRSARKKVVTPRSQDQMTSFSTIPIDRRRDNKVNVNHHHLMTTDSQKNSENPTKREPQINSIQNQNVAPYKGIMNDEESLFYSSKKKKVNKGVIDVSGENKKIFYTESDFLNGNFNLDCHDTDFDENQKFLKFDTTIVTDTTDDQSQNEDRNLHNGINSNFNELSRKLDFNSDSKEMNHHLNKTEQNLQNQKETSMTSIINLDPDLETQVKQIQTKEFSQTIQEFILSISAPSKSYTVLTASQTNHQNRQTQVTPLTKLHVKDDPNCNDLSSERNQYKDHNEYLHPSQTFQYFPPSGYFNYLQQSEVNSKFSQDHQQQQHQSYPLEILQQRPCPPPYSQMTHMGHVVDGSKSRLGQLGPQQISPFGHCYLTNELTIPFGQSHVGPSGQGQRGMAIDPGHGQIVQMPQIPICHFVTPLLNQPFNYTSGDLQNLTVALTKPNRRNVATQMGQPSLIQNISKCEINQNMVFETQPPSAQAVVSPRPNQQQQQIFYSLTPAYFYTPTGLIQHDPNVNVNSISRQTNPNFGINCDPRLDDPNYGRLRVKEVNRENKIQVQDQQSYFNVVPPPTRYRDLGNCRSMDKDCAIFEQCSSRDFSKQIEINFRNEASGLNEKRFAYKRES